MAVTLINGYVLLPNPPDWMTNLEWSRGWQTGITPAITGAERRQSMRALAREQLSWVITALSLEERALLDARLDAASKSGLVCAPFWGRGIALAADVNPGANTAQLAANPWVWKVNDYALFMDANNNFEVVQITALSHSVTPDTADETTVTADNAVLTADEDYGLTASLTFAPNVAGTYASGLLMWPLLFGKFSMEKQNAFTSWHGDVKVTLSEFIARHHPVAGVQPPPGAGLGAMDISDTFVVH